MIIRPATHHDIPTISKLAHKIWWPTYSGIIPDEQIEFMLEDLYSPFALKGQMKNGISFLIAERDSQPVGFAAWSLTEPENKVYKLEKLYILPSEQGQGTGKQLIGEVTFIAKSRNGNILELNVNRGNPAFEFYKKLGFEVYQSVDIPCHRFVLSDYVMRKSL